MEPQQPQYQTNITLHNYSTLRIEGLILKLQEKMVVVKKAFSFYLTPPIPRETSKHVDKLTRLPRYTMKRL